MENISLECLNPQSEIITPKPKGLSNPRVSNLSGKTVGVIWCGKSGGENFLDVVSELLKKKFPKTNIMRFIWGVPKTEETILKEVDTFIYGVGDSGIGAWESIARTIALEKLGKPGVVIFAEHLIPNAVDSAYLQGLPGVRMVTVPSMDYFPARESVKLVRPVVLKVFDNIVKALTAPINTKEANPKPRPKSNVAKSVKFTADNYAGVFEEFNRLFLENHCGDGLPLVPPTKEGVTAMLAGTKRSPGELIGTIPSPDGLATIGKATVEKIAINAVMAGAKPEYLPVIIAAMEGLTDKSFSPHVYTSEGSFTIVIAVTGPIAQKIKMNAGFGLFGHGFQANNTIGRAVRLCLINLGHLWPGEYDLALIGRPSSHTFYVFSENDKYLPWEPYHVNIGYRSEDSCVTVSTVGGHGSVGIKMYGGGTVMPWTSEAILKDIINDVAVGRRMFAGYCAGVGIGLGGQPTKHIFILHPEMANELKKMGFTGKTLKQYIIDRTSVPFEALSKGEIEGIKARLTDTGEAFFGSGAIPQDQHPVFKVALKKGGKVPVVASPDDINIFVAGGITGYTFGMSYMRGAHQTKLIRK
jgi:hypothetical protein